MCQIVTIDSISKIAPLILNLDTRWRSAVNFSNQTSYRGQRTPGTQSTGGWMGPRVSPNAFCKREEPCVIAVN